MVAKGGALLGQVAVNVEHAAVVVAEDAGPVLAHPGGDLGGVHPIADFLPGCFVGEEAGHEVIGDTCPVEDAGDFRCGAGLAMLQPAGGHQAAVAELIELIIVKLRYGLEVEHHHRHARLLHHGQDGGRQRVSGDVEKNQLDLLAAEQGGGRSRFGGMVHQTRVHQVHAEAAQTRGNLSLITREPLAQAVELRPVSVEADAKKADTDFWLRFGSHTISISERGGSRCCTRSDGTVRRVGHAQPSRLQLVNSVRA